MEEEKTQTIYHNRKKDEQKTAPVIIPTTSSQSSSSTTTAKLVIFCEITRRVSSAPKFLDWRGKKTGAVFRKIKKVYFLGQW